VGEEACEEEGYLRDWMILDCEGKTKTEGEGLLGEWGKWKITENRGECGDTNPFKIGNLRAVKHWPVGKKGCVRYGERNGGGKHGCKLQASVNWRKRSPTKAGWALFWKGLYGVKV